MQINHYSQHNYQIAFLQSLQPDSSEPGASPACEQPWASCPFLEQHSAGVWRIIDILREQKRSRFYFLHNMWVTVISKISCPLTFEVIIFGESLRQN